MKTWDLTEIDTPNGTRSPVVLHSTDEARAVLIALDAGQALGDHQVHERAWVMVLDGSVRMECGGETVDAGPGFLARFEPGERRSLSTDAGARLLMLLAPWPGAGHFHAGER